MKTTNKVFLTIALIMFSQFGTLSGENISRPESDNYIKGVTCLNNGDIENAFKYLNTEIENNPENGYAHCYMSLICSACSDIKLALEAANSSLKLIPESDTEYRSFAYYTRSILWGNLGKWEYAIKDITKSININPDDAESYKTRAEMLINISKYEEAINDLEKAVKLNSSTDITEIMLKLLENIPDEKLAEKAMNIQTMITMK